VGATSVGLLVYLINSSMGQTNSWALPDYPVTGAISTVQLLYGVKETGGKPDRKPYPLLYGLRNIYRKVHEFGFSIASSLHNLNLIYYF